MGFYAQDQWTLDRLTLNLGLRLDWFRSDFPDQNVAPTLYVPVERSFPGQVVVSWKDLNPRLGASWDILGTGKTALKVSANRYVIGEGTGRASTINPIQSNNSMARQWTDRDNDRIVDGDPFNPLLNDELGPSQNLNFGRPVVSARYDPEWAFGMQNRPYNWEFSAGMQHELVPRVSVNASYFRRIYGNFTVVDNALVSAEDYSTFCVTAPLDPRLPEGGGEVICGLRDLNNNRVGQIDRVTTFASNFGEQIEHWNGIDLTMNARLPNLLLQGGVSSGRTYENDCEVVRNLPESGRSSNSERFCSTQSPFLTQVKLLGAVTLPYGVQLSGTFQSSPGPQITGTGTFVNAQIAPSLGRALSSGANVSIELVEPKTQYGERLYQMDFRLAKRFVLRNRLRMQGTLDLFNALNNNTVLVQSNTYGATTGATAGATWQRPQAILPARIVKVGVQMNF
jgi:hypothetical protein